VGEFDLPIGFAAGSLQEFQIQSRTGKPAVVRALLIPNFAPELAAKAYELRNRSPKKQITLGER
jgi:hypothetical protein